MNKHADAGPARRKDPYWWMHPAFKGSQALALDDLEATANNAYVWIESTTQNRTEANDNGIPVGQGKFKEFAQLLFKINDYKPGPVKDWYVVVCTERERRWAVGQLRADPDTPVQIFSDLVFESEDAARDAAQALKKL